MVVMTRNTAVVRKSRDSSDSFGLKQLNKVLVLHIRDQGTSTLAAEQVYDLLKDMDMHDHPIHRHCFVGDMKSTHSGVLITQRLF